MEVITIESKAFQELSRKLDQVLNHLQSNTQETSQSDAWLDSKAVCQMLNISTRTLYRMKKEHQLTYSILRGRCLFKHSDVEHLLQSRRIVPHLNLGDLQQNYQALTKQH